MINIGAADVVNFLKTCDEPVTRKQIADGIGYDPIKVSHILRVLIRFNEVDFVEHPQDIASELVGYLLQRRTRFFFLVED